MGCTRVFIRVKPKNNPTSAGVLGWEPRLLVRKPPLSGAGALATTNRKDFEHLTGFYGNGYKSDIRRGMYHGKGEIPSQTWQREMRRLYFMIKQHAGDVPLRELQDFQPKVHLDFSEEDLVPADAWQMSRY
jgi:hypothetical protein